MSFSAMMAARATLATASRRAEIQKRLTVARRASAPPAPIPSRLPDEWAARSKRPRVVVSMVMAKSFTPAFVGASDAAVVTVRGVPIQRMWKSFNRRFNASAILPIRDVIRFRGRFARRIIDPRCPSSGFPLFSRSSSNRSDGNIVAHPAG